MKFSYDPRYNIAYLRFSLKKKDVQTLHISNEINIDIAPNGDIYGIELLNANRQLQQEDKGTLVVINEATGQQEELSLMEMK